MRLYFKHSLARLIPSIAILVIILLWIFLSTFLLSRRWFVTYKAGKIKGILVASGLASLMGLAILLVDLKASFPLMSTDFFRIHFFFYPIFGYVVEVIFHLLPLALTLFLVTTFFKDTSFEKVIWPCILIVAIIEPIFQTALGFSRPYPTWVTGYVFVHIFLINLFQLLIFKRYDFVSMYSFRLVYYAIWHILWGHVRLCLLFLAAARSIRAVLCVEPSRYGGL